MAEYDNITPESLKTEMLAPLEGTVETREGSYANTLLSPVALQIHKIYQQVLPRVELAIDPDETAGDLVDKRAADFGITRDPGKKAHVQLKITAVTTRVPVIPAGTMAETIEGLRFVTLEDAVFEGRVAMVNAEAEHVGLQYNVDADTIVVMTRSIGGVESVTNPEGATGGADVESDSALLERYRNYLRRPVSSGNVNHYIQWATEVSGVDYASVEPLWNGPGTVRVVIAGPDKGAVDEPTRAACAAHIEEERPIGASVTVVSIETLSIDVEATVTLTDDVTAEQVEAELRASLTELLSAMPYGKAGVVRYSRVLALLLACDGVEEYSSYTLNGKKENVAVTAQNAPTVGTVTITKA